MTQHGHWTILKRDEVYRSPWLRLLKDDVLRPDGKPGTHDLVYLKPGVTVVVLDDSGQVHLTEEFHYAVGRVTLEGVSGGREADEPFVCEFDRVAQEVDHDLQQPVAVTADRGQVVGKLGPELEALALEQ